MVAGKKSQSALLAKYFGMYKKNPRSKVFAPLAEAFRKLGMLDDAYKILKEGIRVHPNYALGYIVLAHCYFDQEKYELAYNTLRPIVSQNADNISMQKVFARSCIELGHLEEALDTYKYMLFMNPKEKTFAQEVKRLEDDLMVGHKKLTLEQLIKSPNLPILTSTASDDDWVQVDFGKNTSAVSAPAEAPKVAAPIDDEGWVMKKPGFSEHPILNEEEVKPRDLEDDYYADEFELEPAEEVNAGSVTLDAPLVSHTLIDLYCAQEYYDKAIELLEKIIELNPADAASINKLKQVKSMRGDKAPVSKLAVVTEQDGHDELISIIENQVKARSPQEIKVEVAFNGFLAAIKQRADQLR